MYNNVTENDFVQAFNDYGRKDNFTRLALLRIFDYLTDLEDEMGEEIELDVVAICCEYVEYESIEDLRANYKECPEEESEVENWLQDRTSVVTFAPDSIVLASF